MTLIFDDGILNTVVSGTEVIYKGTAPVKISSNVVSLLIDNQLLHVAPNGTLTVNLDEIGSELTDKANTDLSNLSSIGQSKLNNGTDKYGIRGDYTSQFGILECPNGILKVEGMKITLQPMVVMQCAGQESKTTITGPLQHTIISNSDIDIFYAGGTLLECGSVFYQENEPDDGQDNYVAWWKPSLGKWQFKSNETGNVFRPIVACRLAHIHTDGATITRVDYIGNRILDDEIFVEKKDLDSLLTIIQDLQNRIAALEGEK